MSHTENWDEIAALGAEEAKKPARDKTQANQVGGNVYLDKNTTIYRNGVSIGSLGTIDAGLRCDCPDGSKHTDGAGRDYAHTVQLSGGEVGIKCSGDGCAGITYLPHKELTQADKREYMRQSDVDIVPQLDPSEEEKFEAETREWLGEYLPMLNPNNLPKELKHTRELAFWAAERRDKTHPVASLMTAFTVSSALLAGRVYTPSYATVSLYTTTILQTGTGKDTMRIIPLQLIPTDVTTGAFTSVGALEDELCENPAITTIIDEHGDNLYAKMANKGDRLSQLMAVEKSLYGNELGTIYKTARYSSGGGKVKVKDPVTISNVCFGIAGITTREQFLDRIDSEMLSNGYINRFIVVDGSDIKPIFLDHSIREVPIKIEDHIEKVIEKWSYEEPTVFKYGEGTAEFYFRFIGDVDQQGSDIAKFVGEDQRKRELSVRWRQNAIKMATALSAYELFDDVPKWLLAWCYNFVKFSGLNFEHHLSEKEPQTEYGEVLEKAKDWFKKHRNKWITASIISRYTTRLKGMKQSERKATLDDLVERGFLETRKVGRSTQFRVRLQSSTSTMERR